MRTTRDSTLPIALRREQDDTLPQQLTAQLRELVNSQVLRPGDPLPSTRALATQLGVARGSVVTAYEQLTAEGWFETKRGSGTSVNSRLADMRLTPAPSTRRSRKSRALHDRGSPAPATQNASASPRRQMIDMRPGRPLTKGVAGPEWRSAWRRAADADVSGTVPRLGLPELRQALADYLRLRGVVRSPDAIVVTGGAREGLALLLLATQAQRIGVEDPGYPSLRKVLERYGVNAVPLATDTRGLKTDRLPTDDLDSVVVTPSHQYPLGGSLPAERRQQLLAWARAQGTLVIEDDYDSQLRYTSEPLPALASLDEAERVVMLGTFSKILTPSLGIGYLVVPPHLTDAIRSVREDCGDPVGLVEQRALAHYLASGSLTRHTQRMRALYRRRRETVTAALAGIDGTLVYPMDGGLHCVVAHDRDDATVIARLHNRGVHATALSEYWATQSGRAGLVFGFGDVSDAHLEHGLAAIRSVLLER